MPTFRKTIWPRLLIIFPIMDKLNDTFCFLIEGNSQGRISAGLNIPIAHDTDDATWWHVSTGGANINQQAGTLACFFLFWCVLLKQVWQSTKTKNPGKTGACCLMLPESRSFIRDRLDYFAPAELSDSGGGKILVKP